VAVLPATQVAVVPAALLAAAATQAAVPVVEVSPVAVASLVEVPVVEASLAVVASPVAVLVAEAAEDANQL